MKANYFYKATKERFGKMNVSFHITTDILEKAIAHQLETNNNDIKSISKFSTLEIIRIKLNDHGVNFFHYYYDDMNEGNVDDLRSRSSSIAKRLFPDFYTPLAQ